MLLRKWVQNFAMKSFADRFQHVSKLSTMSAMGSGNTKSANSNCNNMTDNGVFCIRNHMKVTLCGALGKVGQPLSLILKQIPLVNELALYDLKETSWLRSDLDLMDTNPKIKAYCGCKNLDSALKVRFYLYF